MIYNHAPEGYRCPFCQIAAGLPDPLTQPSDVVYRTRRVTGFIASHWFPNNPGHVLLIPNQHYENLYDLPVREAVYLHSAAKKIALAMKAIYGCDGISTRQHNEPAGNQDVWHFHLHVFPRWSGDDLYMTTRDRRLTSVQERKPFADKLKLFLSTTGGN
jgi:histidine triad (HIT) family protein